MAAPVSIDIVRSQQERYALLDQAVHARQAIPTEGQGEALRLVNLVFERLPHDPPACARGDEFPFLSVYPPL